MIDAHVSFECGKFSYNYTAFWQFWYQFVFYFENQVLFVVSFIIIDCFFLYLQDLFWEYAVV